MPDAPRPSSASAVARGVGRELGGFEKFLLRGNVVDLAVGVVIGAAFGNVVQALVKDFLTPLVALAGGNPDFSAWASVVRGPPFPVGDCVHALVALLLVAPVGDFLVVLPVAKVIARYRP